MNKGNKKVPNNQWLIAMDLDGTLLKDNKTIGEETITILKKLSLAGCHLVLVSGREITQIKEYWDALESKGYAICNDGQLIYEYGGKLVKQFPGFEKQDAERITKELYREQNLYFSIYIDSVENLFQRCFFLFDINFWMWLAKKCIKKSRCKYIRFKTQKAFTIEESSKIVLWKLTAKKLYLDLKKRLNGYFQVFWMALDQKIQLMPLSVNKLYALEEIRNMLGVEKNNVIVFGNDGNDMAMLNEYKYSFAVENATEEVKSTASFVTYSNEEEGVKTALMNFFEIRGVENE